MQNAPFLFLQDVCDRFDERRVSSGDIRLVNENEGAFFVFFFVMVQCVAVVFLFCEFTFRFFGFGFDEGEQRFLVVFEVDDSNTPVGFLFNPIPLFHGCRDVIHVLFQIDPSHFDEFLVIRKFLEFFVFHFFIDEFIHGFHRQDPLDIDEEHGGHIFRKKTEHLFSLGSACTRAKKTFLAGDKRKQNKNNRYSDASKFFHFIASSIIHTALFFL